jgi:hypothetical protein
VASFSASGVFAGRAVVAVVAFALVGLAHAAAVQAVGAVLADGTVRTAPSRMAAENNVSDSVEAAISVQ